MFFEKDKPSLVKSRKATENFICLRKDTLAKHEKDKLTFAKHEKDKPVSAKHERDTLLGI